ncbi:MULTISPECIES: hypothetical protein, partial [unclassified Bartonella]|uniref:hypothetical protein n=1 Tax=unclassified Bartonella TaxID=2645622 RepID=UPI0035CFE327
KVFEDPLRAPLKLFEKNKLLQNLVANYTKPAGKLHKTRWQATQNPLASYTKPAGKPHKLQKQW